MLHRKVVWGVILILIGLGFLLANFGFISYDFWKFWPLILVLIGASMLLKDDEKKRK